MGNKILKIRASQTGAIMTGTRGKTNAQKFAEMEEQIKAKTERLNGLSDKANKTREKLQADLSELAINLEALRPFKDVVELSETTKGAVLEMFWQNEYGIEREINNKFMDKGTMAEEASIELARRVNGWDQFVNKNVDHFENEYLTGTPDLIFDWGVVDIKSSWSPFTFPLLDEGVPTAGYFWQLQSYLALTGKDRAVLSYCLVDTPEVLIQDELYKWARNNGVIETPGDVELKIRLAHNFSRVPEKLRVKNFEIERDDKAINELYERVENCRKFYAEIKALAND